MCAVGTCLRKMAESGWTGRDSSSCFISLMTAFTFTDLRSEGGREGGREEGER